MSVTLLLLLSTLVASCTTAGVIESGLGAFGPDSTTVVPAGDDGAEMVLVPAGEFWMGSDARPVLDRPRHRVYLDAFYIDKYEVRSALFARFVSATGWRTTAERAGWSFTRYAWKETGANWRVPLGPHFAPAAPAEPVVQVSWWDADAYCRWAGKRLPTDAEWEKAARGTDERRYAWGDDWDASRLAWREGPEGKGFGGGLGRAVPVGSYPGDVSPYGAYDMTGNVSEWVADWSGPSSYYGRSPERNPQGPKSPPSGTRARVIRGGSWFGHVSDLSLLSHGGLDPEWRGTTIGFRCARSRP